MRRRAESNSSFSRRSMAVLTALTALEIATLATLLINMWTEHDRVVTQTVGPIHGVVYVAVVLCAAVARGMRLRERIFGAVPVVGGLLAVISALVGQGVASRPSDEERP